LQEFQALDHHPIIHRNKKIPIVSRKEEGKERDLSQSGTETSSMLLQYTTYYNTQKVCSRLNYQRSQRHSHTQIPLQSLQMLSATTTTTKGRAACEANPFSSRSGQEVPPATASGGQTNQRNAQQRQTTGLQPDELAEEQDNSQDNSESCSA
jgi:hypothetical protein